MSKSLETERKFIIKMPSSRFLSAYEPISIVQTYLSAEKGVTHRVRKTVKDGDEQFYETKKTRLTPISCIEEECLISRELYLELSRNIRAGSRPIRKTRYRIPYLGHTVEIDVYPEWRRHAVMEIELSSEDEAYSVPSDIEIVSEVTGIGKYSNSSLADSFPDEDHL